MTALLVILALIIGFVVGWFVANRMNADRVALMESDWSSRLSAAQSEGDEARAEASAAVERAESAKGELSTAKAQLVAANAATEVARDDGESARSELAAAIAEGEAARSDVSRAEAERDEARGALDTATAETSRALADAADARSDAETARSEADAARADSSSARADAEAARVAVEETQRRAEAEVAVAGTAAPPEPDDLTRIEGIGPKIQELLDGGGITTFDQLGSAAVHRIQEILEAGGGRFRLADPATWPEQAALAAAGAWDALGELQDRFKGGRA